MNSEYDINLFMIILVGVICLALIDINNIHPIILFGMIISFIGLVWLNIGGMRRMLISNFNVDELTQEQKYQVYLVSLFFIVVGIYSYFFIDIKYMSIAISVVSFIDLIVVDRCMITKMRSKNQMKDVTP